MRSLDGTATFQITPYFEYFIFKHLFTKFVCMGWEPMSWSVCGGHRTTCRVMFSTSLKWVLGIELWYFSFVATAFSMLSHFLVLILYFEWFHVKIILELQFFLILSFPQQYFSLQVIINEINIQSEYSVKPNIKKIILIQETIVHVYWNRNCLMAIFEARIMDISRGYVPWLLTLQ